MKTGRILPSVYQFFLSAILLGFLFFCLLPACSPKVQTEDQTEEEDLSEEITPDKPNVKEGCERFRDHPYGEEFKRDYVIYRDMIKSNDFEGAFVKWTRVYENTPSADGNRWTVFGDGIRIYESFLQGEKEPQKRDEYVATIFRLYDELVDCYPQQKAYVSGRKAFDYYYKYPEMITDSEQYQMFKYAIDEMQMETPAFVINPFTALLVNLHQEEDIPTEQAQYYADLIPRIVEENVEKGENLESWRIVQNFALPTLERFESIEDFYPCEYYMDKYYINLDEVIGDCNAMLKLYSKLRYGKCDKDAPELANLLDTMYAFNCIEEDTKEPKTAAGKAIKCLKEGQYSCAIREFDEAAETTEDSEKKADYYLIIAKIYYSHLKDYPTSRRYALKAAKVRPNWGDPYILIGKLYASSGPLCGPGTGFDSQVVTWVAIDKWIRARSIDPSVASEANRLINQYTKYMPDREDLHQRILKEGDQFTVECWIQETTTIRAN